MPGNIFLYHLNNGKHISDRRQLGGVMQKLSNYSRFHGGWARPTTTKPFSWWCLLKVFETLKVVRFEMVSMSREAAWQSLSI